jgi:hypothetical protein
MIRISFFLKEGDSESSLFKPGCEFDRPKRKPQRQTIVDIDFILSSRISGSVKIAGQLV